MMRSVKMGTCPLCETEIMSNQRTAWRLVEGAPARVHRTCTEEKNDARTQP